ncbi:GNAT family N-acetyltransferase [Porphyromonadaceae bacterium OttesenSCG-928-L07]|nr:GNAT family N-acetyltransferase [Porphyromonadaceae bacterium OttesenSCG-928-L07]MDL2252045.1 GNAT family N-acetyltransferase [Odoribacter sp. OttesenSCG-928-J03]
MMQDENIMIRAIEPEDLEYLYKWENNMDMWEVSETITPFSHFTLKKYIENAHRDIYELKQLRLMIVKRDTMEPIGSIELYGFDPFHLRAGIGIMIHDKENRKQGFAKGAINLMLYYAFDTLGLHQIYGYIPVSNVASLNLFKAMGFESSGCKKEWLKRGDNWDDVEFIQMLASDWRNKE